MRFSQRCAIFVCLIFFACHGKLEAADSSFCGNWISFKDEKCFKLIDDTLRTFDEAEQACVMLEDSPTLSIIRSKEEQDFLANYVFKTLKKIENVWIGARFSNNKFHWIDNSDLSYTNWVAKGTKNKSNLCVQMQADEDSENGKWIDESCEQKKLVVCQKAQSWSIGRLQKIVFELRDSLDASNKIISDLKHNLDEANKKIGNTQNSVPIGFIYVQLPKEKSPAEIWPSTNWTDVSTTYAGVFFRVNGGDSAAFGQIQEENAPRIDEVSISDKQHNTTTLTTYNQRYSIPKTGWSYGIYTGAMRDGTGDLFVSLKHSSGEIRPRNMAFLIWKRIG